jgi:ankyrin repeat protein
MPLAFEDFDQLISNWAERWAIDHNSVLEWFDVKGEKLQEKPHKRLNPKKHRVTVIYHDVKYDEPHYSFKDRLVFVSSQSFQNGTDQERTVTFAKRTEYDHTIRRVITKGLKIQGGFEIKWGVVPGVLQIGAKEQVEFNRQKTEEFSCSEKHSWEVLQPLPCSPHTRTMATLAITERHATLPFKVEVSLSGFVIVCCKKKVSHKSPEHEQIGSHYKWAIPITEVFQNLKDYDTADISNFTIQDNIVKFQLIGQLETVKGLDARVKVCDTPVKASVSRSLGPTADTGTDLKSTSSRDSSAIDSLDKQQTHSDQYNITDLVLAIDLGSKSKLKIQKILEKNPNLINMRYEKNLTPIQLAFLKWDDDIIELLLDKGAELTSEDSRDDDGDTPFQNLIFHRGGNNKQELRHKILDRLNGEDDSYFENLMFKFAFEGKSEELQKFDVDKLEKTKDSTGYSVLHYAVASKDLKIATWLVKDIGMDVEIENEYGHTPLMVAAWNGHDAFVRFLIERGANIYKRQINCGFNALSIASLNGYKRIVEILYNSAKNKEAKMCLLEPDRIDLRKFTPLMLASLNGYESVVIFLIQQIKEDKLIDLRKYINIKNADGNSALLLASEAGCSKVVQFLCEHGADVFAQNVDGYNALFLAVENDHQETVDTLLSFRTIESIQILNTCKYSVLDIIPYHEKIKETMFKKYTEFCRPIQDILDVGSELFMEKMLAHFKPKKEVGEYLLKRKCAELSCRSFSTKVQYKIKIPRIERHPNLQKNLGKEHPLYEEVQAICEKGDYAKAQELLQTYGDSASLSESKVALTGAVGMYKQKSRDKMVGDKSASAQPLVVRDVAPKSPK